MHAETQILGGPRPFPSTHWSLVLHGRDPRHSAYRASLETLCRKYWGPVYLYVRRNWHKDVEAAKDLTQAFFLAFLEKDYLRSVEPARGTFRSFVCAALRHFLCKEARHDAALKRSPVPLPAGPEELEEDWKRALVEAALERLRADENHRRLVDLLVEYDLGSEERPTYETLAGKYGWSVSQVTNGLHAIRKAFKNACLEEVRETVATDEDFREEAARLFGVRT